MISLVDKNWGIWVVFFRSLPLLTLQSIWTAGFFSFPGLFLNYFTASCVRRWNRFRFRGNKKLDPLIPSSRSLWLCTRYKFESPAKDSVAVSNSFLTFSWKNKSNWACDEYHFVYITWYWYLEWEEQTWCNTGIVFWVRWKDKLRDNHWITWRLSLFLYPLVFLFHSIRILFTVLDRNG